MFPFLFNSAMTVILTATLIHGLDKSSLPNTALSTICKVASLDDFRHHVQGLCYPTSSGAANILATSALRYRIPSGADRCLRAGTGGHLSWINGPPNDRFIPGWLLQHTSWEQTHSNQREATEWAFLITPLPTSLIKTFGTRWRWRFFCMVLLGAT